MARTSFTLVGVLVVAFLSARTARSADELLETAVAGHRASVESIETLYTNIELSIGRAGKPPNGVRTTEYWRDRGLVRLREKAHRDGTITEYKRSQGTVQRLFEQPRPEFKDKKGKAVGLLINKESRDMIETDAWVRALFVLPTLDQGDGIFPQYSLAEAVRQMKVKKCVEKERQGIKVVEIQLQGTVESGEWKYDINYTVYLDPSVNWLIREVRLQLRAPKQPDWDCSYVVGGFSEVAPSIYFPQSVELTGKMDGAEPIVHAAVFRDTVVNKKPKLPFPLDIPIPKEGVYVTDKIKGVSYQADASGRPIGTPAVLREVPPLPTPPANDPLAPDSEGGTSRFLLWIALATGGAAVLVYFVRKRVRAKRQVA